MLADQLVTAPAVMAGTRKGGGGITMGMSMVERIKATWYEWIPSWLPIVLALCWVGMQYQHQNDRLDSLEKDRETTSRQMQTLTAMIDGETQQIQQLQDKLDKRGDISARRPKRNVSYPQDSNGISENPQLLPR
jgi:hypothetical protein